MTASLRIRHPHRAIAAAALIGGLGMAGRPAIAAGDKDTPATGRVHYTMTSPKMNGTMTMAWIDHGKRFRQETKMSVGQPGQQMTMDTWTLGDGRYLYSHQPMLGKQVMRMPMPKGAGASPMGPTPFPSTVGGKVVGKATLLGHPCEIRAMGQGGNRGQVKAWVWKGMPLRVETAGPQGGAMVLVATQVETAPHLSAESFKVPAGYEIRDMKMPAGVAGGPGKRPR